MWAAWSYQLEWNHIDKNPIPLLYKNCLSTNEKSPLIPAASGQEYKASGIIITPSGAYGLGRQIDDPQLVENSAMVESNPSWLIADAEDADLCSM